MHNINYIRENPTAFDNDMKKRGENIYSQKIIEIDEEKRKTQTILQNLLSERNKLSKLIGKLKSENKDVNKELKRVDEIKLEITTLKELEIVKEDELKSILTRLPNIPHSSTPIGKTETTRSSSTKFTRLAKCLPLARRGASGIWYTLRL